MTTPDNIAETNNYTYYLTGAKKTEANPNVATTYVYDTLARLSTETDVSGSISTVKAYTYDLANNRLSFIATVGGTQIHNTGYTYDN
ncbi:MAG: hypothetical protein FWG61_00835, partial [Firmicutes bacterium]|nr:hypothetical protein [Bacillota bacterium]